MLATQHCAAFSRASPRPGMSAVLSTSATTSMRPMLAPQRRHRGPQPVAAEKKKFGSFDEMLASSELPVLVDFYATWCGPCQMLAPILSSLSVRLKGKLQVVKVDSDKNNEVASQYHIMALPTLILFKSGKPVDRIEGMLDEQQLFDRLSYHLATPSPAK